MGRCRDHRDKAGEKASRMAWTPGEDARSSSPQDHRNKIKIKAVVVL